MAGRWSEAAREGARLPGRGGMRRHWRWAVAPAALAFMLACRSNAALARAWVDGAAVPALAALNRLTAAVPFPVLEPAALLLAAALILPLPAALRSSIPRGPRPAARWGRRLSAVALALVCGYGLMWYPAYWAAPGPSIGTPDPAKLEALCAGLSEALSASTARFPPPGEAARLAAGVAGVDGAAVKCARYPEWMGALRLTGLFAPWTGEAIIDPTAAESLVPFTAVHELMHLRGVADEGQANIAAWRRCMDAGGAFADSARVWALRYAWRWLDRLDPDAAARACGGLDGALRALCAPAPRVPASPLLRGLQDLLGLGGATESYDALAAWLTSTG